MKLTEPAYLTAAHFVATVMGLQPTEEQLRQVIEEDRDLVADLNLYYTFVEECMDTQDRDSILDAVSLHLTGEAWPTNFQNVDMRKFEANIRENASAKGWDLVV